jgi:PleD family two-component response regulator
LGLAISKAYVEILKIWVKSEEEMAAHFILHPISNYTSGKESNIEKVVTIKRKENQIKELKILIAEDDKISKFLISIMTKPFSREAIMVSNGRSCRSLSQNPDLDSLLIDMNMPVMGGFSRKTN